MATDNPMQLGMVGLGRMGANLVRRLVRDGHRCVVYDVNAAAVEGLEGDARGRVVLEDLVAQARRRRAPSGSWCRPAITQSTLDELASYLDPDDVVIDGGNSYYRDDMARAAQLSPNAASTTSTAARAAASGASSAATA
jgi:6-phosphogluconate dehydrogenase